MAAKTFDAVIYLPIIVITMIIAQIYFEDYRKTVRSHYQIVLSLVVTITYFVQEYCLLQISLININEGAFMMVVPFTMLFRNNHDRLWWGLLVLTPPFANAIQILIGVEHLRTWWVWLPESATFLIICALLTSWRCWSLRVRYVLAILSLGLVELVSLAISNRFTIANVAAATFGLLLVLIFEGQRYQNEIKNQQRINLLRRESERDDLTGLLNYRALSQEIKALTTNRSINNIVIGGLDIDHFKKINDTYGHFVGNEVLNHFSTVLRNRVHTAFPNHGYVYRFGGEEFSIVVFNHPIKEVYSVLQIIEEEMAAQPIITKEGITISISFSASLTNHLNGEPLDETLKRADKMLYSVKNSGRGWIVTDHHKAVKKADRATR